MAFDEIFSPTFHGKVFSVARNPKKIKCVVARLKTNCKRNSCTDKCRTMLPETFVRYFSCNNAVTETKERDALKVIALL